MIRPNKEQAAGIAQALLGVDCETLELPGELESNFLISGPGFSHVLKLAPEYRRPTFELVEACLRHIDKVSLPASVPRLVVPTSAIRFEGEAWLCSTLSYLEGSPLAELRPRSMAVLEQLGGQLAVLGEALADFEHPTLDRNFPWRMENATETIQASLEDLEPEAAALVEPVYEKATRIVDEEELPGGIIHNDANDHNVLVHPKLNGTRLAALIDFGDVARGWRVADPAIATTYAMFGLPDPLEAACAIARGYVARTPLTEAECRVFIPLVGLRLCLSVCIQSRQMREQPENGYLAVSQRPARKLLEKLAKTDWRTAEFRVREACGLEPNPARQGVSLFLEKAQELKSADGWAPVVPPELLAKPCILDLSVGNPELPNPDENVSLGQAVEWVRQQIAVAGATVGVGRYGEARLLYEAPGFVTRGNQGPESRTVHLGIDLFLPSDTPVFAPLDGTVVSVADNSTPLDFGPTVILRHQTDAGSAFHTLFGHLNRKTLTHLSPGSSVLAGEVIGWLGDETVNGGWPSHLHFQVMAVDPLRESYDGAVAGKAKAPTNFPGVTTPRLRSVWESVVVDPAALVGLPPFFVKEIREAQLGEEIATERIYERRLAHFSSALTLSYVRPLHIARGWRSYLFDAAGRRYLDTVNNIAHVGHCNRRVGDAISRQIRVLNTNTRYLHSQIVALAEDLLAHFPDPLQVVYFVCSGSEANELALRLARSYTGRDGVVTLAGGYHGNTRATIEVSPYKHGRQGGYPGSDLVSVAPMPDPYRGVHRNHDLEATTDLGLWYAERVAQATAQLAEPGVAAFIAEPVLSCGGQIEPPPGYLTAAYEHVRRAGGLCIADEVQIGFGRLGDAFWGFDLQGVVPDIVTMGKAMGNGHPIAAVVTTREIADSFADEMEYFNSFGGNPVACAAARAVLAEVREQELQGRARKRGEQLLQMLRQLAVDNPVVGDVRGRGLFIGLELVRNPEKRTPFPEGCAYLVERMRDYGVLMSADGVDRNVLKIKPPLVFSSADCKQLVGTLADALRDSALQEALR